MSSDKLSGLVEKAKAILFSETPDRIALWQAYVSIEYAIMDLKLQYGLEGQVPPAKLSRKSLIYISEARSMLSKIDPLSEDKKKLLYDLRACRNAVKALVASAGSHADSDRRSQMS